MREGLFEAAGDDLSLHALLYASGELEGEELAAFEERLALDQHARDALAQAVELSLTAEGKADQGPRAETRARIRHRLRQRRRERTASTQSAGLIGHPFFWSLIGVLAALLFMLVLGQVTALHEAEKIPPSAPKPMPTKSDLESRRGELEAEAEKLAARLPDPAAEAGLMDVAQQLVTIDRELRKLRVGQLEKELRQMRSDLSASPNQQADQVRQRYQSFIKK